MTDPYAKRLRLLAHAAAELEEGIYLGVSGPSFETPAEIRAFRGWGADLVGMSTVHEVIVARHMGIEVLGISCVTNMAAGILDQPINHQEVMETGARVQAQLTSSAGRPSARHFSRNLTSAGSRFAILELLCLRKKSF